MTKFETRSIASMTEIDPASWQALYGDSAEASDYFTACERATPPSFSFSAIATHADDRLIAGGPVFKTSIALDMVLDGVARKIVSGLGKVLPSIATVPIVGIGTPHSHDSNLAFAPDLSPDERLSALESLMDTLETVARRERADIVLLKDVSSDIRSWADTALRKRGYSRITALPISTLRIPDSEEAYMASLSGNMRSNLRRRLKRARNIKVDIRTSTDGLDAELHELRGRTMGRAATDYDVFEEISPAYYAEVLKAMGDKARLLTYWLDDKLIGFSLVLLGKNELIQTYNGMRYPEGPDNGIFYLDWMTQIRLCLEHRIPTMQSGVTTYLIKARLGCEFHRSYIYVRHKNMVMNAITRTVSPFINLERSDPSLKELGDTAPFV